MKFSPLQLTQSREWPYSYTITNADTSNSASVGSFNVNIILAVLNSSDTLDEANARPNNILLYKYLKLLAEAPKMLDLLTKLADGYECPPVMPGDNVYDSHDALLWETDHYSCLVDEAAALLTEMKGGEDE